VPYAVHLRPFHGQTAGYGRVAAYNGLGCNGRRCGEDEKQSVPFNLFETKPPGHGDDEESRVFSVIRAQVHTKGGAAAVVLAKDGEEISPHVQPSFKDSESPLSLVWAVRQSRAPWKKWAIKDVGKILMAAYYQSLQGEGLPKNIRLAESIFEERYRGSEFKLMPLDKVVFHTTNRYVHACHIDLDGVTEQIYAASAYITS
jgi:hypothetical protein